MAIQTEPEVQYWVANQEAARFDWTTFLEATYSDLNDPVGNTLTLGNAAGDRLLTEKFNYAAGFRQKNQLGGEFEIAQKLGARAPELAVLRPESSGNCSPGTDIPTADSGWSRHSLQPESDCAGSNCCQHFRR